MRIKRRFALLAAVILILPMPVIFLFVWLLLQTQNLTVLSPPDSGRTEAAVDRLFTDWKVVILEDGVVRYSSHPALSIGDRADDHTLEILAASRGTRSRLLRDSREGRDLYILVPFRSIRFFRIRLLRSFVILLYLMGIVLVLCVLVLERSLTGSLRRSLKRLTRQTALIASGRIDVPPMTGTFHELAPLARSITDMQDSLREARLKENRFIMGLSHDLKTPLGLIGGYAEAIVDLDEGDREEYLGIIKSKIGELEGMINSLIDLRRMSAGEWRLRLEGCELQAFLEGLCSDRERGTGRRLVRDFRLTEGLRVQLDPSLFRRLLDNLISNAAAHSRPEDEIRLGAYMEKDSLPVITVSDRGEGIPSEDLPHIFDPYFQGRVGSKGATVSTGSGLGLSIVRWICELHGWSADAESRPGEGSCFRIRLG